MHPWSVFGARSRPGWPRGAPRKVRIMGCGLVPMCLLCLNKIQKMSMRLCPNNTQTIILKHVKNHENCIENLSQMSPISLKNLLNSILGSFWNVFGAISRPGRLQDAPRRLGDSTLGAFLGENGAQRSHSWDPLGYKMAPKSCFRA